MGPGGTATSGMGPRGAAEGPRGTATWDRVIKGLHALSHNNCKTLIQAPSGTLDIRLFKIRLNSPKHYQGRVEGEPIFVDCKTSLIQFKFFFFCHYGLSCESQVFSIAAISRRDRHYSLPPTLRLPLCHICHLFSVTFCHLLSNICVQIVQQ